LQTVYKAKVSAANFPNRAELIKSPGESWSKQVPNQLCPGAAKARRDRTKRLFGGFIAAWPMC
jgi:hypothetical protein